MANTNSIFYIDLKSDSRSRLFFKLTFFGYYLKDMATLTLHPIGKSMLIKFHLLMPYLFKVNFVTKA